jgi:Gliding motility associated protein GldN
MRYLSFCFFSLLTQVGFSQLVEPRVEDQFWKKRVMLRIELNDKINQSLKYHDPTTPITLKYTERDGIVVALLNGLQRGEFPAYDHHTWKTLDFKQVQKRMKYMEIAWNKNVVEKEDDKGNPWENVELIADELEETPTFASASTALPEEGTFVRDIVERKSHKVVADNNMTPYEHTLVIVEDWIFDKNSSQMRYLPRYVQIMWVDPTGILPDRAIATFEYKDILPLLEKTQYKEHKNEASEISMRHVLDAHLYKGFLVNISGKPMSTLDEANKRYQEIIEFESYLWSN